jgi:photosystem II stability/assembly factor-like uncharacterized protein
VAKQFQHSGLQSNQWVDRLVINPSAPQTLYVATFYGVFRSTDGGTTWAAFNAGLSSDLMNDLVVTPDGKTIFVGTYGSGVFKNTTGSSTWQPTGSRQL